MINIDDRINDLVARHKFSGIEDQVDYGKFYLYSVVTHSTAIEGSTITEVENQLLFDEGISPAGRSLQEQMMNLDTRDAYLEWGRRFRTLYQIDAGTLCAMSASIMRRTGGVYNTPLGQFDSSKGELRLVNVRAGASGRSYIGFQKVPAKLEEFCQWLSSSLGEIGQADPAAAYRLSFKAHFRLVTIHPWVDGNGRAARLLMNMLQDRRGLPMSKIQRSEKAAYIQALIDARESDDEDVFVDWAMAQLASDLEEQLAAYEKDTGAAEDAGQS